MNVAYASVRRWRKRKASNRHPVTQPGPQVTTPEALQRLEGECAGLDHKVKRSKATAELHTKYRSTVSRRDIDDKIALARRQKNAEYRRGLKHLEWRGSGIVWSMDDTQYGTLDAKCSVHNVRDIGAQYVMEPLVTPTVATGAMVARNLEKLFKQHGAPLFMKRDCGGNLCCYEVDDVLARWMVLPLTSPPYYPKYNGAIEWSQGQLKCEMERVMNDVGGDLGNVLLHARLASHSINHRSSPTLQGRFPCHALATSRQLFTRNERRIVQYWMEAECETIFQNMGPNPDRRAAWRQAATRWLTSNGLLIIRNAN
jgi:transposase InsO family protein